MNLLSIRLSSLRRLHITLLVCGIILSIGSSASGSDLLDTWKYTLRKPPRGWQSADFDDSQWKSGNGGFGTPGTPGERIGVYWNTQSIWLRKTYKLESNLTNPALLIHHDDDARVFLNGKRLFDLKDHSTEYKVLRIPVEMQSALREGENVLAIRCLQRRGGQFIDAHLIDAEDVPSLPKIEKLAEPFSSDLSTEWGETVDASNVWAEYPRPQLERTEWQNLNGEWSYSITEPKQTDIPTTWQGKILVPFCLESKLGGVQRLLDPSEVLWYRRHFSVSLPPGTRQLLNFEAVDYLCEVFINGQSVGVHQGGNTPFSFDVTQFIKDGENELVVRVVDKTEAYQLCGKQTLNPRGIWYTQVSGIWQTVWTEQVPSNYIKDIKISTDASKGTISIRPDVEGTGDVRVVVRDGNEIVVEGTSDGSEAILEVPDAKLWSPESPHLYDIEVQLVGSNGSTIDKVQSYTGIRSVGKLKDDDGHWRFSLNGKQLFHWGTLDQGWWPDGLLTPPSDEAIQFEIQWLKKAGFNMIRKHIKVEPRRYYYHCDRVGMLVWQDHVSANRESPKWSRLEPGPRDGRWPLKQHEQFMLEFERMIDTLENHPSIVVWVPFNERWGQHRTMKVGEWAVQRDPSRLINVASGGNFWPVGDIVDAHKYPHPDFPFHHGIANRFDKYIKVVGEFGGHGFPIEGHLWDANRRNWGYGGLPTNEAEYKQRYIQSLKNLAELQNRGIAGAVYTQTTDVEGEINGLMTYDRKVIKIPKEQLAELHKSLFDERDGESLANIESSSGQEDNDASMRVVDAESIRSGLESHDRSLYIKTGWIRDPYIVLGPDDYYYLTGTQPNPDRHRESIQSLNTGLGKGSIVGEYVRIWRSKDLIDWEYLGEPFSLDDTVRAQQLRDSSRQRLIWAPELHWLGDRWALVHCPRYVSSLALTQGAELTGPWTHPMDRRFGDRHDPSLFQDDDGTWYLLWQNTLIAPLTDDLSDYADQPVRIDPSGSRPGPAGKPISRIGHEGATMMKVGGKYVHLGTAWSTDQGRKGSYNLYYCVADSITGPYGPRKFAGRFLGHGTPFQTRDGKWWCTAFFNANVPPLPREGIQERDLSETAQTINQQGVTIVPLDVGVLDDGEVYIRAKDPAYATPGPDEVQQF